MKNLIKGAADWHDTVNQNFEEVGESLSDKLALYVNETLPDKTDRKKNTLYFKVTDTISSTGTTDRVKVSPTMGIKIV